MGTVFRFELLSILPHIFVLSNLVVFFIAFKNKMSKGTCEFSISFIKEITFPLYKINVLVGY